MDRYGRGCRWTITRPPKSRFVADSNLCRSQPKQRSNKKRFQCRITHDNKKATRTGRLHDVSNPKWLLNRKTSI